MRMGSMKPPFERVKPSSEQGDGGNLG